MTKAVLTSRERVRRMFARQDQDRVPRYDSYWPDTLARWQRENQIAGEAAVFDVLACDFHSAGVAWPAPFPGQRQVLQENGETVVFRDEWGATLRQWRSKDGTPEHLGFDCDTREKWEACYKPALLNSGVQVDLGAIKEQAAVGRKKGRWCLWHCADSFEATRKLMGDAIVLAAMASDPEWVQDVSRTYTDCLLREFEAIWSLGLDFDGVFMWGDMAYNRSTVCSPRMYRSLIWPDHRRVAEWIHARGMQLIYHTDGNVNGVIDLYIEAGINCLQPLEAKASMDLRQIAPKYGDRMAFMGNVNVLAMLDNDREKIEAEVVSKLAAGKATRGYVYHSDHSIPPQVSWDSYKFVVDLLNRYGRYE